MNKYVLGLAAATTILTSAAFAEGSTETFLKSAVMGNFAEIQMGEMAQQRGYSKEVKDFGAMLVRDHAAANKEAIAIAAHTGVDVPTAPSNEEQEEMKDLSKYKGKDFDKEFIDAMVKGHEETIEMYKDEAKRTDDKEASAYAAKYLPVIQGHRDTAKTIDKMQDARK